ncbi:MAG: hypothetical protein WBG92_20535 [Thiohalocapsa sp.]
MSLVDSPRLTVKRCQDLGPATKLLSTLTEERDPDTIIITIDDDVAYPPTLVQKLVQSARLYPNSAIGFTGWQRTKLPSDSLVQHFNDEISECLVWQPVDVIEGTRGVLYRRRFFNQSIFRHLSSLEAFRYHDDIFFAGYLSSREVPRHVRWFDRGFSSAPEHWTVNCQDRGLHTTPNWYQLGKECWDYWASYFEDEKLEGGLPPSRRLQLNADTGGREGFTHHSSRSASRWANDESVADLTQFPWPWKDGEFREVIAFSRVPIDERFCRWLAECLRITERGGHIKLSFAPTSKVRKILARDGVLRADDLCVANGHDSTDYASRSLDSRWKDAPCIIECDGDRLCVMLVNDPNWHRRA